MRREKKARKKVLRCMYARSVVVIIMIVLHQHRTAALELQLGSLPKSLH